MGFQKATKKRAKLRLALCGPTGSGKTYSALAIAEGLGQRVALIDTECGSASLYADRFDFDVLELESGHPERYIEAIKEAEGAGYDVLIIDSLSHAWMGKDGALELVDKAAKRSRSGNSFTAWRDVTPLHNKLVDALTRSKCHVIATMRAKMAYEVQEDSRGKKAPVKMGMEPIQRDGLIYEFTLVGDMDVSNTLLVSKTRCSALAQAVIEKPGRVLGEQLRAWLEDGEAPAARPVPQPAKAPQAPPKKPASSAAAKEAERVRAELARLEEALGPELYAETVQQRPDNLADAKAAVAALQMVEREMLAPLVEDEPDPENEPDPEDVEIEARAAAEMQEEVGA